MTDVIIANLRKQNNTLISGQGIIDDKSFKMATGSMRIGNVDYHLTWTEFLGKATLKIINGKTQFVDVGAKGDLANNEYKDILRAITNHINKPPKQGGQLVKVNP